MEVATWFLYLYMTSIGVIDVPGHFDTLKECKDHGKREIQEFKRKHKRANGYAWCIRGGKGSKG